MGKYRSVAIIAAELLSARTDLAPSEAWKTAAELVFPASPSSREKSCPRGAFLGLCEIGAVEDVPAGDYTESVKNKLYATRGLELLERDGSLADDQGKLWSLAIEGEDKQHNSQMDVVIGVWLRRTVR